ncbi:MAG: ATP-grasp domain-containing protein [Verrucomicrobiales bacterium]|nr:ATP-grasp domain-containing protein [Verrucomicrobiales bacterium]
MGRFSRYVSGWFQYPDFHSDPDGFIDSLIEYISANKIGTYIPSHEEGFLVAKYRDRFPQSVKIPISDFDLIDRCNDKARSAGLAEQLGVDQPKTVVFETREQFRKGADLVPSRGVVKSVGSHGSHGISFYSSPGEFREIALGWDYSDGEIPVIQEFVEGNIYAVSVMAWEGEPKIVFTRRNIREKEPFGGACTVCESVDNGRGAEVAVQIVKAIGFTGPIMFEFLVDEDSDRWCLMEINPRYWGTTAHELNCGLDFPFVQYCLANELPYENDFSYSNGLVSRWITGEMIGFEKRRRSGRRVGDLLKEYFSTKADFAMDFAMDDPVPFFVQAWLYFKHRKKIFSS